MVSRLLERLAAALSDASIPYMLVGGQAVLLYGLPRLTDDVDVTLGIGPSRLPDLLEVVEKLGWDVLVAHPREFVRQTLVLPCRDPLTSVRVDFILSFTPYERQALARAHQVTIGQTELAFAALEDLIILKIVAGRPRDLEDVRGVLIKNPTADLAYVRKWLRQLELGASEPLLVRFDTLFG